MKYNCLSAFLITMLIQMSVFSQDLDISSLNSVSYDSIRDTFYKYEVSNPNKAEKYALAYILKAKNNNDSIRIANGYTYMCYISNKENTIKYADSVIFITQYSKHKSYPTGGFLLKGYYYYEWGDYEKALNSFLDAYEFALSKDNLEDQLYIQNSIASLKNKWGNYEEALLIYKDMLSKVEKTSNYKIDRKEDYFNSLYNLSIAYIKNKHLDSSLTYINRGIKESLVLKDSLSYYSFVFISGTRDFDLKKYDSALDSLNKALPYLERETNIAIATYYKAKIFNEQGLRKKSIKYFLEVDSIFQKTQDEFPQLTDMYQTLSNEYKRDRNLEKQLFYLNKLLYVDSILDLNYVDINKLIVKRYDTPILLKEKNSIIAKLREKESSFLNYVLLLVFLVLMAVLYILFLRNRNMNYKKRFDDLLQNESIPKKNELDGMSFTSNNENKNGKINISSVILENIVNGLNKFERNKDFKDVSMTIQKLAKQINTNTNYLSKVINKQKEKNFSNYINDLRINYAVDKLKNDLNYRKYTIEAIANDSGFNKAQSFSSAFYRKTGIKPSYFINELNRLKTTD